MRTSGPGSSSSLSACEKQLSAPHLPTDRYHSGSAHARRQVMQAWRWCWWRCSRAWARGPGTDEASSAWAAGSRSTFFTRDDGLISLTPMCHCNIKDYGSVFHYDIHALIAFQDFLLKCRAGFAVHNPYKLDNGSSGKMGGQAGGVGLAESQHLFGRCLFLFRSSVGLDRAVPTWPSSRVDHETELRTPVPSVGFE